MPRTLAAALAALLLTGCAADYDYRVIRIGYDPDTGRNYLVCQSPDGTDQVEITKSAEKAARWRVGERCADFEVEAVLHRPQGPTTTASTPVSLTPTTSS